MHEHLKGADLEEAYENGAHIAGGASYPALWEGNAALARSRGQWRLGLRYGAHPRMAFDLALPHGAPKGLIVFIHGGYWKAFDRGDWSWMAAGATQAGWAMAILGYPLTPEVGIPQITRAVHSGLEAAASEVEGPLLLAGHSAGGHLAARMLMPDGPRTLWHRLAAVAAISPLADLRPLMRHPMNKTLGLLPPDADTESPVRGARLWTGPLMSCVGALERPAFHDQAKALADHWEGQAFEVPVRHHFDVIDELANPGGSILSALLAHA